MKKVININFQGRIIPIEESAHEILKQYTESLSKFFANEEGKEEIINDIEGRIAELFAETLKKGSTCICDDDVNKIIASMGRPEDFETEVVNVKEQLGGDDNKQNNYEYKNKYTNDYRERTRLCRDENDKILGGVCGGLANYLRVDASIIRILIVLLVFGGGTGVLIYILLWIILPSQNLQSNLTKRLYRNPEEKVIGGVASGLAAYFNISVLIPRLIFAFPLVIGIVNSIFHNLFWNFSPFPSIYFGSFGGSLTLIYVVLWAVIPEAKSASEKLEMRGDKIDLNSIKSTIQDDLEGFKTRAEKYGKEFNEKGKQWGQTFTNAANERGKQFTSEVNNAVRTNSGKVGHAISIVFKAFFLFIAGMLAFALTMGLIGLMMGGFAAFPIKNFFIYNNSVNILVWITIACFLIVPVVALIVWLARRLMRVQTKSRILPTTFGTLWFVGLIACIALVFTVANNFRTRSAVEDEPIINQPTNDKLFINVSKEKDITYSEDWFGVNWDEDNEMLHPINEDSMMLRSIRVQIVKSKDTAYHIKLIKFSRGNNTEIAKKYATNINFKIEQLNNVITIPNGFAITKNDKFRNQQVLIIVYVPVGKKIQVDDRVKDFNWFDIHNNNSKRYKRITEENWDNDYINYDTDEELIMKEKELKSTQPKKNKNDNDDENKSIDEIDEQQQQIEENRKAKQEKMDKKIDSTIKKASANSVVPKASSNQVYLGSILLDKFSM